MNSTGDRQNILMNKKKEEYYMGLLYVETPKVKSFIDDPEASIPVVLDSFSVDTLSTLVNRYYKYGFVIFENNQEVETNRKIEDLSKILQLGEPFITGFNKTNFSHLFHQNKLNTITSSPESKHIVFDNNNGQGLHSDGTFEPIGTVKSTILFCEQEAVSGGDTILFDSVNAYLLLKTLKADWAKALLDPKSLRRASALGDDAEFIEPAFKELKNGEVISRFTVDTSSDWEYGFNRVPHLSEAFGFLVALTLKGSGFSTVLKLHSNQGILFANDKIAHGRTPFINSDDAPRKMVRGLYEKRPKLD